MARLCLRIDAIFLRSVVARTCFGGTIARVPRAPVGGFVSARQTSNRSLVPDHPDDPYRAFEANAIEDLKREAFKAGGNAVMEVGYAALARGQGARRCFRAIECRAIAMKKTPVSPP